MTIKHLGGIFGRNPTFNDVTIDGGIYFEDGQAGNFLDDYEEGTFTPTIIGTSSAGTGTYTSQTGKYTKIGNIVFVQAYIQWTAHTGTGNMRVSLPFTSYTQAHLGIGDILGITKPADTYLYIRTAFNSAEGRVTRVSSSGTEANHADLAIDTAGTLNFSGVIRTE